MAEVVWLVVPTGQPRACENSVTTVEKVDGVDVWAFWLIIALVLGVAEVFTLTAALGQLGGAAVFASVFAAIGLPMTLQLLVFAFASVVGFVVLRPSPSGTGANRGSNISA